VEQVARVEELRHRCVDVSMCISHVLLCVVLRARGVGVVVVDGWELVRVTYKTGIIKTRITTSCTSTHHPRTFPLGGGWISMSSAPPSSRVQKRCCPTWCLSYARTRLPFHMRSRVRKANSSMTNLAHEVQPSHLHQRWGPLPTAGRATLPDLRACHPAQRKGRDRKRGEGDLQVLEEAS
jgi:hypothetical protein